jgi:hypothetical protein
MQYFLQDIYCSLFEWLFGTELANYISGWNPIEEIETIPFPINIIGSIAIIIAIFFALFYYYVLNHPRFNRWWSWLIVMAAVGLINLFIGYGMTMSDVVNGLVPFENNITGFNCWMFGVANFLMSSLFYFIISFIIKWWSRNCKHSPFL